MGEKSVSLQNICFLPLEKRSKVLFQDILCSAFFYPLPWQRQRTADSAPSACLRLRQRLYFDRLHQKRSLSTSYLSNTIWSPSNPVLTGSSIASTKLKSLSSCCPQSTTVLSESMRHVRCSAQRVAYCRQLSVSTCQVIKLAYIPVATQQHRMNRAITNCRFRSRCSRVFASCIESSCCQGSITMYGTKQAE